LNVLRELSVKGPITLLLDFAYLDYTSDPQAVMDALQDYAAFAEEGKVLVGASLSLSKALTLYGARSGALVFPWSQETALQSALAVSCRGLFSNCPRAPQSLLLRLQRDGKRQEQLNAEHRHWSDVLQNRAVSLDQALKAEGLMGAPWQGGFFATLMVPEPKRVCEKLKEHGVFVVPMPEGLRVGICGMKAADAPHFAAALRKTL
jgi:aromatic-amino-acid transaminase